MSEDDHTAISRRPASRAERSLAFLLGLACVALPVLASAYTLDLAKKTSHKEAEDVRREAVLGYDVLSSPVRALEDAVRNLNWRATRLERECDRSSSNMSIAPAQEAAGMPEFPDLLPLPPKDLNQAARWWGR